MIIGAIFFRLERPRPEPGTPKVLSIFGERDREVRISKLSFIEIQSVFAMKVRGGVITRNEAGVQRARLLMDIAAGEIEVCAWTSDHFRAAERLIGRHSFSHRLRTLERSNLRWHLIYQIKGCWISSLCPTRHWVKLPVSKVWLY